MTFAFASRFSVITSRVSPPAEALSAPEMPSMTRELTSSWIFCSIPSTDV